ncbi:MAG: homoserine kinase [Verrucomicrobiota bacterium]
MDSVITRVPATTANLGPGYDCLGVALRLYNRVTVRRGNPNPHSMAAKAAALFFKTAELKPFEFHWQICGDIPQSRGLGSSVTVRLGILHGLNELAGGPLEREEIFMLCSELEGHPDNAAPAEFGGFTVASAESCLAFPVSPKLKFVLLIPDFEVSTPEARKVLPADLQHELAVVSAGNAARITAAFASGQYEALSGAFEDYLHQPFRQPLIPFLPDVIGAGEEAGAIGGYLSGSGSTIACVTLETAEAVAAAMQKALPKGIQARTVITTAENRGVQIDKQ